MTKRGLFNWSIWIGLWTGLYTVAYLLSPLGQYGVMWATYVALPIYFLSGVKKSEFLNYSFSYVAGVGWGWVYIAATSLLLSLGMTVLWANGLVCFVATAVCLIIHFILLDNTPFNKVPAIFGAIASTFSTGGEKIVPLMITLVLGACLAYVFNWGLNVIDEEGRWCVPKKQVTANSAN